MIIISFSSLTFRQTPEIQTPKKGCGEDKTVHLFTCLEQSTIRKERLSDTTKGGNHEVRSLRRKAKIELKEQVKERTGSDGKRKNYR